MTIGERLRRSWNGWLTGDTRLPGPWWAGTAWTLAFATACALGFTVFGIGLNARTTGVDVGRWWSWFQSNMVVSLTITLAIRGLFWLGGRIVGRERLRGWSRPRRSLYFSLLPLIGVAFAWPLGMHWGFGVDVRRMFSLEQPGSLVASVALATLITLIFKQFFAMKNREIQAENRATEAQLRLLQAQIEPHFLFNTLANVVSLMQADPPRAKAMLESFVDYLRASLTGLGQATHTLGDEIDLIEAYLRIIKMRLEDRLEYTIDVPAALRGRRLPALSVQPLVENAIVHGIEPQVAGGTIRVAARLERGTLRVTIEDDGAGMGAPEPTSRASSGSGTALGNIRERLRQSYGGAAGLELAAVAPRGVRASLSLPADA